MLPWSYRGEDINDTLHKPPRTISDEYSTTLIDERHKLETSGGFLLHNVSGRGEKDVSEVGDDHMSKIAKGKRKAANGNLVAPKSNGVRHSKHDQPPSLGSSPLATEPINVQPDAIDTFSNSSQPMQSHVTGIERSNASITDGNDTYQAAEGAVEMDTRRSAFGYDTDPAQIVNLALSLNESRRRNVSGSGFLLPRDSPPNKPFTSFGQQQLGLPYSKGGGSLRRHLHQQRQGHRNPSPRSPETLGGKGTSPLDSSQDRHPSRQSLPIEPGLMADLGNDPNHDISDATLSRVERAKQSFELLYEYRRLLQYLPKIQDTFPNAQSKSHARESKIHQEIQTLGRAYNPLQYIRNRKVRCRERKAINASAVGWMDIGKVRTWVDTVKNEREDGITHVDDRFPLPPFEGSPNVGSGDTDLPKSSQADYPGRPYNDWTFASWDLLADAYWLDQEQNLRLIEDPLGRRILDQSNNRDNMSQGDTQSHRKSANIGRGYPSLERLQSDLKGRKKHSKKTSSSDLPIDERSRRNRWTRGFIRSREPSASEDSDEDRRDEVRHQFRAERDHLDNIALEKQMMDILAKEESESRPNLVETDNSESHKKLQESPAQKDCQPNGYPLSPRNQRPHPLHRLQTDMPLLNRYSASPRASLDEQRRGHQRMSSDDFDSTGPNSPSAADFIPSIAINLSPPKSPRLPTIPTKKALQSKLSSLRRAPSPAKMKPAVSEHDFAEESKKPLQLSRPTTTQAQDIDARRRARSTDPGHKLLSPTKSRAIDGKPTLHESRSLRSFKDSSEPESKLRGFLKGGRLAEIVGTQVSRAGDMLWRKDGGNNDSSTALSQSGYETDDSVIDDTDISALENSPYDLSRATTNNDETGKISRISTLSEKPRYFMTNLPNFRPSNLREQSPKSPKASPVPSSITPQELPQKDHNERGRSNRFDKLAPPRMDLQSVSLSPSSRELSQDAQDRISRDSSANRSEYRITSHGRLNDVLGLPGKVGTVTEGPTPTGLSGLEAQSQSAKSQPAWSISDRGVSATIRDTISTPDIARVRALLLSSGIKANEIIRRADAIPNAPSQLLQGLSDVVNRSLPTVPLAQEHVVAARLLIAEMENSNRQLHDAEDRFTNITVKELSGKIRVIDKRISDSLSPLVRDSADDADSFSATLTTTHTLAVKQLNDNVDRILRRRRQRSRLLRRGGWAVLEWALLGVMWMVWFVVVIVRLVRGVVTGCVRGVRWLFWL